METSFSSLLDDEDELLEDDEAGLSEQEKEIDESLLIANLGLSPETMDAMANRGIFSLFPVQAQVLEPIMSGRDVVCRAKTGSGKTLAFALPVVENLLEEDRKVRPRKGRAPRCVVLAPTRELANQVSREFESVCPALKVDSFYGGVSIVNQIRSLERGVDVVVGTPGRVIDLMERGALKLTAVRYAILDEADSMLDMGFEQDMETILGAMPAGKDRQTLLFSATLPKWVKSVAKRYQQNPLTIDLVGEENTGKLADTIRLLVQQVDSSQKVSALQGLLAMYGNTAGGGKAIIFVNTKAKADEVNMAVNEFAPCEALHGDISQAQREKSLAMFREGKYSCLVATDVAARGLDIPSVDLVVHYDVPQDNEAFLHRSGRTGRAGKRGTAVVLFTDREARSLGLILRATKVVNAELVGAPDPAEVMRTASRSVLGKLDKVDGPVVDYFLPAAERLVSAEGAAPARVLAAALAALAGFRHVPQPRSLLTYEPGFVTLRLMAARGAAIDGVRSLGSALRTLAASAPPTAARTLGEADRLIGRIRVVEGQAAEPAEAGMSGLAFDMPTETAEALLTHCAPAAAKKGWILDKPSSIALEVEALMSGGGRGGGGGGRYGDRGGDRYGRSDRYGGRSDARGGGGRSDRYGGGGGASRSYDDRGSRRGGGGGGGSYDDWSKGGSWGAGGGRAARGGGSSSGRGGWSGSDDWSGSSGRGSSSRSGAGAGGASRDSYWDDASGGRAAGGGRGGRSSDAGSSKPRRLDSPAGEDSWGQW
ncbi:hypothetical protein GPECTOR_12g501 [Gonium pectorale]|uniref:Uncharacterized protein n=1 Tax=Gonium pectorale TaxID=33097 RepID=A0A150GP72_GONPE|nr:hypothetical protein GPECTOR_12g501 [Gonium pectorale]|eukprot:KXZ51538.1 hypothetical protein GPECTOR_12g501 [Gonium pectorale]